MMDPYESALSEGRRAGRALAAALLCECGTCIANDTAQDPGPTGGPSQGRV